MDRSGMERVIATSELGEMQGLWLQLTSLRISLSGFLNPRRRPPSIMTERETSKAIPSVPDVTKARADSRASVRSLS